jgi:hypothetical protein
VVSFGAVDEILGVRRFITDSRIERTLQMTELVLDLKGGVVSMDAKSIIGGIFNGCEGERGVELTDSFKKCTGFRMVIG